MNEKWEAWNKIIECWSFPLLLILHSRLDSDYFQYVMPFRFSFTHFPMMKMEYFLHSLFQSVGIRIKINEELNMSHVLSYSFFIWIAFGFGTLKSQFTSLWELFINLWDVLKLRHDFYMRNNDFQKRNYISEPSWNYSYI